jgi:hypothetical protein
MCFGINPAMWHHRVGKPNFPPRAGDDVPRRPVLAKPLRQAELSPSVLFRRMEEYDAVVGQNAAR